MLLLLLGSSADFAQSALPSANDAESLSAMMKDGLKQLKQKNYSAALKYFEAVLDKDKSNAEALFYAGSIYIILNRTQEGLDYLERSAALAPANVRLHFILAETYGNLSLIDKAVDEYRKIEKLVPGSREAKEAGERIHMLLGKKYGEQGKFDEALKEFSAVLTASPDNVPALMSKGVTLAAMGRLDEAQTALEKALQIQPDNALLHRHLAEVFEKKGDIERSREQYEQLLRSAPPDSPLAKLAEIKLALIRGAKLLAEKQLEDARSEFEKVLVLDPGNELARFNLAVVYHGLGDMQRSEEILHSLVKDNPNNLDAQLRLGTLYLESGRLKEAVNEFESVIEKRKDSLQAQQAAELLDRVRSNEKLAGKMTLSERLALDKAAVQQNPDDRQAWLDLGLLYVQMNKRDEAIEALNNVIRLNPDDPRVLGILAGLYEDADNFDKALEAYQHALDLEKNQIQRRNLERQLAVAKARKAFAEGDLQNAEAQFKEILREDKNNYVAHFFLALIYAKDGKIKQAAAEYQEVIRIVPGNLGARLNLALAYEQLGRDEDALTEYQYIVRSGAPQISDVAKTRLDALMKRIGGFSFNLSYSLDFDSNSNLSSTNPNEELRSDTTGSVIYRRKIRQKRIYWGLSFTPTYSIYHQQQFDFLQMNVSPFTTLTWRGVDFSANYGYSQTSSVLVHKNYNTSNSLYADALKRFKMISLLPFLTAEEQRKAAPSVWRVNVNYRNFNSETSPIYDSNTYSFGLLLNQGSSSGWSWTASYSYVNNNNLKTIGNDFAYSSHGANLQLSKSITPKLNVNGAYSFVYSSYKHPDSVTTFTKLRVNKFHVLSAGLNYTVNDAMRLYSNILYQRNFSNLPTGFILSTEDASTLVGIQSASLGDYHKYGVTAGIALNF